MPTGVERYSPGLLLIPKPVSQGRIRRLQQASRPHFGVRAADTAVCALCDRAIAPGLRDAHHLLPKSRGGTSTVLMHRACHKHIHALFTETQLARHYASVEALKAHPDMAKFIAWVKGKPDAFNPPARRSKGKGYL